MNQNEMQRALRAERKAKARSDTRRALFCVFIVIPVVVVGFIAAYRAIGYIMVGM